VKTEIEKSGAILEKSSSTQTVYVVWGYVGGKHMSTTGEWATVEEAKEARKEMRLQDRIIPGLEWDYRIVATVMTIIDTALEVPEEVL
jgi:hypothetical protein